MKEEKEIPKTYYEKILISSGEVPEKDGVYHTSQVYNVWNGTEFVITHGSVEWWLKPVPSPKQEAVDVIQFLIDRGYYDGAFTAKQLYDKFKEK